MNFKKIEKFKNIKWLTVIPIIVAVILFIISGVFIISYNNQMDRLDAEFEANNKTIEELYASIDKSKRSTSNEDSSVEYVDPMLNSAYKAGNALAKLETDCFSEDFLYNAETLTAPYLNEPQSGGWYYMPLKALNFHWEFNTTYSFTDDSVPVMWTCYAPDNSPLAFATGTYETSDGKFHRVDIVTTALGQHYLNEFSDANGQIDFNDEFSENHDESSNSENEPTEPVTTTIRNSDDSTVTLDEYEKKRFGYLLEGMETYEWEYDNNYVNPHAPADFNTTTTVSTPDSTDGKE